jgi:hypothetical protein
MYTEIRTEKRNMIQKLRAQTRLAVCFALLKIIGWKKTWGIKDGKPKIEKRQGLVPDSCLQ